MDKTIRHVVYNQVDDKHKLHIFFADGSAERYEFGRTELSDEWVKQFKDALDRRDMVWASGMLDLLHSIADLRKELLGK